MEYKNHFSGHASIYAEARPDYPPTLMKYLASICLKRSLAWDCACGNGQAAIALSQYFDAVVASDASLEQLQQAGPNKGVNYFQAMAEQQCLAPACVDLVVVAQALHWFQQPAFFSGARSVMRPGGIIAVWCYGLHRITPDIDTVTDHVYEDLLGKYWPPERHEVETAYRNLNFPFDEVDTPVFEMVQEWTLEQMLLYLESWSAFQRYTRDTGKNPLPQVAKEFEALWGSQSTRTLRWPLFLRVGRR